MAIKVRLSNSTNYRPTIDFSSSCPETNEKSTDGKIFKPRKRERVSKTVYCYSKEGNFIDQGSFEYFVKKYGLIRSTITSGMRKKQLVKGKYFFSFNILAASQSSLELKPMRRNRVIICLDLHQNLIVTGTISYLSIHLGISKSTIGRGLKYVSLIKKKYFFISDKFNSRASVQCSSLSIK